MNVTPDTTQRAPEDRLESLRGHSIDVLVREDVKMSTAWIVVETFGELGFEARLVTDDEFEVSPDRIVFIGGNALWHEQALDRIRPVPREERPPVVVWHSEPLPFPRSSGFGLAPLTMREIAKIVLRDRRVTDPYSNARHMRRIAREGIVDLLTVAAKTEQAFLAEQGIESEQIAVGYHPVHGRLLDLERDIDVLFLGDLRVGRRKRILRRLEQDGLHVHAVGDYSDPRYWGDSRTELLNRTKILLNIPRHPGHPAAMRLLLGMATGALVISEPVYLPEPYEPGRHYVEAEIEEMAETAKRYLADDEARSQVTAEGYAFVTQDLTLKRQFADLLALLAERVQRPAPPPQIAAGSG
jgi:hypothetical protein